MNGFNPEALVVGDRVAVMSGGRAEMLLGYGVVTRVNGHGHISVECDRGEGKVTCWRFRKNGYEMIVGTKMSDFYLSRLVSVEHAEFVEVERNMLKERHAASKELADALEQYRTGSGLYMLDETRANEIKALIDKVVAKRGL